MTENREESNVERAIRLKGELDATLQGAIEDLLIQRKKIQEQLQALGYTESVIPSSDEGFLEGTSAVPARSKSPEKQRKTKAVRRLVAAKKGGFRGCGKCHKKGHNSRTCTK